MPSDGAVYPKTRLVHIGPAEIFRKLPSGGSKFAAAIRISARVVFGNIQPPNGINDGYRRLAKLMKERPMLYHFDP